MGKHTKDLANTAFRVQVALLLQRGIPTPSHIEDGDQRVIVRETGKPAVDYWPLKKRWKEKGNTTRHYGSMDDFVAWLEDRK